MAIERRRSPRAPEGWVYRVRYIDPHTGERLSRTFDSADDAEVFEAQRKVARRQGTLELLDAGTQLLGDHVLDWLRDWAREPGKSSARKSKSSVREAKRLINSYILELERDEDGGQRWGADAIAWLQVRQLRAKTVRSWIHRLESQGVGAESLRRALYVLQMAMDQAVADGEYPLPGGNPVKLVKKPAAPPARKVRPFTPGPVERMRAAFLKAGDTLSAYLVSTLAYSGVRPGEALALQARHLELDHPQGPRLKVEQRNSLGDIVDGAKSTKRRVRTVPLPAALVEDLRAWLSSRELAGDDYLFALEDGSVWNEWKYRNWRRRDYGPAARAQGLAVDQDNPYDLRHVYVSLRLAAGHSLIEVAAAAGHSPTVCAEVYAGVIEEYEARGPIDWEAEIATARAKAVNGAGPAKKHRDPR